MPKRAEKKKEEKNNLRIKAVSQSLATTIPTMVFTMDRGIAILNHKKQKKMSENILVTATTGRPSWTIVGHGQVF